MWDPDSGRTSTRHAAAKPFTTFLDLLPSSDAIAIRSTPDDARRELRFASLATSAGLVSLRFQLGGLGFGQGDRLCSCLPNGPCAAVAFLALAPCCTYAPLNPALAPAELEFELEDMPAAALIVQHGQDNAAALRMAEKLSIPALELVPSDTLVGDFQLVPLHGLAPPPPAKEQRAHSDKVRPAARHDIALVLHTSGTTAKPKIVPLHHENLAVGSTCIASALKLTPQKLCLNVMPVCARQLRPNPHPHQSPTTHPPSSTPI
jgi:acyl-coenzyme A synthetase/AMP-(fatty) acid ligase